MAAKIQLESSHGVVKLTQWNYQSVNIQLRAKYYSQTINSRQSRLRTDAGISPLMKQNAKSLQVLLAIN